MSASTMAGKVLAALSGDVERKAASALASAREKHERATAEREQLAADHVDARDAFESTGSDADASRVQRIAMKLERADRLRSASASELAAAEYGVKAAGLEATARKVLDEEQEARDRHMREIERLTDATGVLLATIDDITSALAVTTATGVATSQAHARSLTAVTALAGVDPSRAAPLREELHERASAMALRPWARARMEGVARLVVAVRKLAALGVGYLDGVVSQQAEAARTIGVAPLLPATVDAALEVASIETPTRDQIRRITGILEGLIPIDRPRVSVPTAPPPGLAIFPETSGMRLNASDALEAARAGLDIVWKHGSYSPEANDAWSAWVERTRGAREARHETEDAGRAADHAASLARSATRWPNGALVIDSSGDRPFSARFNASTPARIVSIGRDGESINAVITSEGAMVLPQPSP